MDPYEELQQKAREMAQKLTEQGKEPWVFRSKTSGVYEGDPVEGWVVLCYSMSERRNEGYDWCALESIVLTTAGELYNYTDLQVGRNDEEETKPRTTIRPATTNQMVNIGSGKPFSKLMEAIERMPWT
jgi:hypothetical protein